MARIERLSQRPRTECKDNNLAVIVHLNFNLKNTSKTKIDGATYPSPESILIWARNNENNEITLMDRQSVKIVVSGFFMIQIQTTTDFWIGAKRIK